jgi:hypothetical protein
MVYGYNQTADGEMDRQSHARCKKALEIYRMKRAFFIDAKICITVAVAQNGILLCDKMREYFLKANVPLDDMYCFPNGYNTTGETDSCRSILRQKLFQERYSIIAVSSWYHIPRIYCVWLTRGYRITGASSWKETRLIDVVLEPLKIANFLLRPFASSRMNITMRVLPRPKEN